MCSLKHFACVNALHLAFVLKIHTGRNVEKRQFLILSSMFPLEITDLGTFDPTGKKINRKKKEKINLRMKCFLS